MRLLVNCSYRLLGVRECQPDASYYIADRVKSAPKGSSVVDLDSNPPPDLAIEIADSSLVDDRGRKGIIYEEIKVAEYWVVDVKQAEIIALKMLAAGGSQRTTESQVLPGLKMALLAEGLQRSRQMDNTEVGIWFLAQVQGT